MNDSLLAETLASPKVSPGLRWSFPVVRITNLLHGQTLSAHREHVELSLLVVKASRTIMPFGEETALDYQQSHGIRSTIIFQT